MEPKEFITQALDEMLAAVQFGLGAIGLTAEPPLIVNEDDLATWAPHAVFCARRYVCFNLIEAHGCRVIKSQDWLERVRHEMSECLASRGIQVQLASREPQVGVGLFIVSATSCAYTALIKAGAL